MNKAIEYAFSDSTVIKASPEQVFTQLNEEVVILHMKDGTYYGLNTVGARIWNLIQEPKSIREVEMILLDEYDVSPEVCHHELLALLRQLAGKELILVNI